MLRLTVTETGVGAGSLISVVSANVPVPARVRYAQLVDVTEQPFAVANVAQQIEIGTVDLAVGIGRTGLGSITFAHAGAYTLTYSLQLSNTGNDRHYADVWLRRNGTDVTDSGTRFEIPDRKNASTPGYTVGTVTYVLELAAGDVLQLWAASDSTTVSIHYTDDTVGPAIPSVVVAVSQLTYTI